jgi:integrase/recombinase XerD
VLTIRLTKLGKSRQLPLHPSTVHALGRYDRQRDELCPRPNASSFFISTRGGRLEKSGVQKVFRGLRRRAGLDRPRGSPKPRLHNLRHSFAARTVIDWHRTGADAQARMLWLSTYMGHVEPSARPLALHRRPTRVSVESRPSPTRYPEGGCCAPVRPARVGVTCCHRAW